MRHTLNRIARHGMKMYHTARHYKTMADHAVHNAARLYSHAIQPGLRQAGIDTREADMFLKNSYDHYSMYSNAINSGINVADGVAANLRGGSFSYR